MFLDIAIAYVFCIPIGLTIALVLKFTEDLRDDARWFRHEGRHIYERYEGHERRFP